MQEFGTLQYLMNYFTSLTFYIWRHVQYCTICMVTIVSQITYIVSLLTFGLWGYYFYVTQGYYINLFFIMLFLCAMVSVSAR